MKRQVGLNTAEGPLSGYDMTRYVRAPKEYSLKVVLDHVMDRAWLQHPLLDNHKRVRGKGARMGIVVWIWISSWGRHIE